MKIFCIGLSRSGAISLTEALKILGYRSLSVRNFEQLEDNLSKYDAFTHSPLAAVYKELDIRFPDSKFILNIRERESWLRSVEKQWAAADLVGVPETGRKNRQRIYGTNQFDREIFSRVYDQHLEDVTKHFKGRDQSLLILDVCGGEGFEKICPFLDKSIPLQPFPHRNSARDTFEHPTWQIKRFFVRHLKAREIRDFLLRRFRR
jgi:Sulfotransferase domain